MTGRPSKYTEKLAGEICDALSNGATASSACEGAGVTYQTYCRWKRARPKFLEAVSQAREIGIDKMGDDCIAIADNPALDPHDKRIMIDTRLRLMGKWSPARYGDKVQHTGVDGGGPVPHTLAIEFVKPGDVTI